MQTTVVIVAAGMGRRMNASTTKQLIEIGGHPILWHTLKAFQQMSAIDNIVLVVKEDESTYIENSLVKASGFTKISHIVNGGNERSDSVANGLAVVSGEGVVMIHDGARPFIEESSIIELMNALSSYDVAILGVPAKDTIKAVDEANEVTHTYDRKTLWQVQTPQAFKTSVLKKAYEKYEQVTTLIYDDAMLVEAVSDHRIKVVEGLDTNIKITTPFDLMVGKAIYNQSKGETNV